MPQVILRVEAKGPRIDAGIAKVREELLHHYGADNFTILVMPPENQRPEPMANVLEGAAFTQKQTGIDLCACLRIHLWGGVAGEQKVGCIVVAIGVADKNGPADFGVVAYDLPFLPEGTREAINETVTTIKSRYLQNTNRSQKEISSASELLNQLSVPLTRFES